MAEKNFDYRHVIYQGLEKRWLMANDFWHGGINVLSPQQYTTDVLIANEATDVYSSDGLSPESSPKQSKFSWYSGHANSYLYKHTRETPEDYQDRSIRVINLPIFQYTINVNTSGILRNPPRRNYDAIPFWEVFNTDCDVRGTSFDSLMRQCTCLCQVFGRIHVLTDGLFFDTPAKSKADQIARGERPYCSIITPLDLVDWETDEYGQFIWIVLREIQILPREPGEPQKNLAYQYRVYNREGWELWQDQDAGKSMGGIFSSTKKYKKVLEGEHHLGYVPLDTMYAPLLESPSLAVESPLADVLDLNRDILNKLSELDELERIQAFSVLCFQEDRTGGVGSIDISPWRTISVEAGVQMPQYISPPSDIANGKWSRIIAKTYTARQLALISRGKAEYSKEERSGEALTIESEDKHNSMAAWASAIEDFDAKIHKTAALWMGMKSPSRAVYSRVFDIKSMVSQIDEIGRLFSLGVEGDEVKIELLRPLLAKKLVESGYEDSEADKLVSTITISKPKEVFSSKDEDKNMDEEDMSSEDMKQKEMMKR